MRAWFSLFFIAAIASAAPPAQYVPHQFKELDDAHGVTLQLKYTPIYDGSKFVPRIILESDVNNLSTDLDAKADTTTTVNGQPLSSNVSLSAVNVNALAINDPDPRYLENVLNTTTPVVNVTKQNNTLNISANKAITFSDAAILTKDDGYIFACAITNTDSSAHTISMPESWSRQQHQKITSFSIAPAARVKLYWEYRLSDDTYYVTGEPVTINDLTADATPASGDYLWEYDVSAGSEKKVLLSNLFIASTYATLPAPAVGMSAVVTDGLAAQCGDTTCTTFGTTVLAGGGALKLRVWYNGTNWTLTGK